MAKKSITKSDLKYMDNTLYNYYYLKRQEQKCIQESIELEKEKNEESYNIKANSLASGGGNGCSVHYQRSEALDRIVEKQIETERKAKAYRDMYLVLDKCHSLMKTFKSISVESQIIIYNHWQKELSASEIAKLEEVSVQAIQKRIEKALTEMALGGLR